MATARKLPSGMWRCLAYTGKDTNGKRKYKSFTADTKKEAEYLAAEYLARAKQEESSLTIGKAVSEYIAAKKNVLSPSTIEGYEKINRNWLSAIKDVEIADFGTPNAQKFVNTLARKLSAKSVSNAWGLVSSAVRMQEPEKVLAVTLPAKRKQMRELPTAAEVIEAVKDTNIEIPALLAMCCSLRASEVRGIRYRDIRKGVLTVRETRLCLADGDVTREQTKTFQSTRKIILPRYLAELIEAGRTNENDFVVELTYSQVYNRFVDAIEQAGLPHMRFHDLRHLNASIMLALGVPEKYAMERGGWSTPSTLQSVYQHTFSAEREQVDKKINAYFEALF